MMVWRRQRRRRRWWWIYLMLATGNSRGRPALMQTDYCNAYKINQYCNCRILHVPTYSRTLSRLDSCISFVNSWETRKCSPPRWQLNWMWCGLMTSSSTRDYTMMTSSSVLVFSHKHTHKRKMGQVFKRTAVSRNPELSDEICFINTIHRQSNTHIYGGKFWHWHKSFQSRMDAVDCECV